MATKKIRRQTKPKVATFENDIKQAVEDIPKLIAAEMPQQAPTSRSTDSGKRRLLMVGVVVMSLVVFTMWALNTHVILTDLLQKKSTEATLLGSASTNVQTALESVSVQEQVDGEKKQNEEAKQKILTVLREQLSYAENTSTTK